MTNPTMQREQEVFERDEQRRYDVLRASMKRTAQKTASCVLVRDLAEWISLERRCCPFLELGIEWSSDDAVWLRLTGGAGVKTFLAERLGGARSGSAS